MCVCVCVVKLPQMFCLSQLLATSECVSSTHYNDSINSYYTVYTRLVISDDLGFYFSWKIVTLRTTIDHPVKDECINFCFWSVLISCGIHVHVDY